MGDHRRWLLLAEFGVRLRVATNRDRTRVPMPLARPASVGRLSRPLCLPGILPGRSPRSFGKLTLGSLSPCLSHP